MTQIRVELELADGSFTTRMLRAGQTVAQFNSEIAKGNPRLEQMAQRGELVTRSITRADQSSKGFLGTLRDISIVTGIVGLAMSKVANISNSWIGDIIKINSEMERLNFQMQSMSTSADPFKEAADNVAYLREQAVNMPFTLQSIANGFVKLKATGTDPMAGSLQAVADGVAAFGGSDDAFNRSILAISQMSGKGVIQMEELRQQLGESMPRAVELMARSMGVSMADLIKSIGTGQMEASAALKQFYAELERTYGGRAQYMMQTFEGQVRKAQTSLQQLAMDGGKGFFEEIKTQLVDINDLLGSRQGALLGQSIGDGLRTAVVMLRQTFDVVIKFKDEIYAVGQAMLWAFGGMVVGRGIQSIGRMIGDLGTSLTMLNNQWITYRAGAAAATAGTIGLGGAAAATGGFIAAMGTAISVAVPIASLLVGGVIAVANAFGIFEDKGQKAIDVIRGFSAASRDELDLAKQLSTKRAEELEAQAKQQQDIIDNAQAQLKARQEQLPEGRQWLDGIFDGVNGAMWGESVQQQLDQAMDAQKQFADEAAQLRQDVAEAEVVFEQEYDRKRQEQLNRGLVEQNAAAQSLYDRNKTAMQARFEDERAMAAENGKDIQDIRREQQEELYKLDLELYNNRRTNIRWEMNTNLDAQKAAQGDELRALKAHYDSLVSMLAAENERIEAAKPGQVNLLTSGDDKGAETAYTRGQKRLEDLQKDIAGVKAELDGANGAVAELQEQIAQGQFGDMGRDEVVALTASLREAIATKEALDAILKGKKDLETDIERERKKMEEQRWENEARAQGKTLTDLDKIKFRLENGFYTGYGPADKIREAFAGVITDLDLTGSSAVTVGDTFRTNTFGDDTGKHIDDTTNRILRLNAALGNTGAGLNSLDFAGLGGDLPAFDGSGFGSPQMQNIPKEMEDRMAIAMQHMMSKGWSQVAASGIVGNLAGESGLNPNAVNPGDGTDGSDSIGVAQWNAERARALKAFAASRGKAQTDFLTQLDFLDHELRTTEAGAGSALQMAATPEAAAQSFMRNFERPSDEQLVKSGPVRAGYAIQANQAASGVVTPANTAALNTAVEHQVKATEDTATSIEQMQADQVALDATTADLDLRDAKKSLEQALKDQAAGLDVKGNNEERTMAAIRGGDYGKGAPDLDPEAARYKEILDLARQVDAVEAQRAVRKTAQGTVDTQAQRFAERQLELTQRVKEAQAQMMDPLTRASSSAYQQLTRDMEQYLRDVETAYGRDSDQFRAAQAQKTDMLRQQRNMEVTEEAAKWSQNTRTIQTGLMTERQQRQVAMQEQIAAIDAEVAAFQGTEAEKIEIVRAAEAQKAAIRQQYQATMDPMAAQMKQWGDLQGNLAQQSTQWMDSLAGGITDLIMGTGDLGSVIKGIMKDMVNMAVKYMMSGMKGGEGGKAGKGAGGGQVKAGKAGKAGKAVGVAHTGGIVGSRALTHRMASGVAFIGAPKFHTGGIIGGPKLSRGEVPIIAKQGEGVFTPEQMSAMGGFGGNNQTIAINAPVTVNANGGTPEQNDDLAKQMARQMEGTMRGVVADELRKQTRQGNTLNNRSR